MKIIIRYWEKCDFKSRKRTAECTFNRQDGQKESVEDAQRTALAACSFMKTYIVLHHFFTLSSLYSNKPSPEEEAAPGFGSHSPVYKVSSSYGSDISFPQLKPSEPAACLEKLKYSSRMTQKISSCIWGCILSVPGARASARIYSDCSRSSGARTNTDFFIIDSAPLFFIIEISWCGIFPEFTRWSK